MTRGIDQATNPAYTKRFLPLLRDYLLGHDPGTERVATDPFLLDYPSTGRARVTRIRYTNRYGATIRGHVWVPIRTFVDPVTGASTSGPFPAVMFIDGFTTPETTYWATAQTLVEHGYVVMTFDPQGTGVSDVDPNPKAKFCNKNGAWRQPQELGVREEGECAGQPPPGTDILRNEPIEYATNPVVGAEGGFGAGVTFYADDVLFGIPSEEIDANYEPIRAPYIFGAFDAIKWLLSDVDPARPFIDATRVGIIGHSIGADAALQVGNGDPQHRFAAVVTYDTFARMLRTVSPRVPTLIEASDHEVEAGPYLKPQDPGRFAATWQTERFRGTGVDRMTLVLGASGHVNFRYEPGGLINPYDTPLGTTQRYGERIGIYYALSWFDRYLKGRPTSFVRGDEAAQQADATERLLVRRFEDSIDTTALGTGRWDPLTRRNVPYMIEGLPVGPQLSVYYPTSYAFDSYHCVSMATGCR